MNRLPSMLGLAIVSAGLLLAGCGRTPPAPSRGTFGAGSCDSSQRAGVDGAAKYAVYLDANGNPLGTSAEDLAGTQANLMCPTPPASEPGVCPGGFCPRNIGGKTYCLRC
jgi:hypothetical protein